MAKNRIHHGEHVRPVQRIAVWIGRSPVEYSEQRVMRFAWSLVPVALASASFACGGQESPVTFDAGGGCIVTRPPPNQQNCVWDVTVSSASACDTTPDAAVSSPPGALPCNAQALGTQSCFPSATCSVLCGPSIGCAPSPSGDQSTVRCGNGCM
jgi:hypothetical protein